MPFAVILGEDELAQGKVKIKEMGLKEGHPEKDGVMVNMPELVREVKKRLQRKKEIDDVARQAEGLRVVRGIKGGKGDSPETQALSSNTASATTSRTEEGESKPVSVEEESRTKETMEKPIAQQNTEEVNTETKGSG